jgi:hypothetical protein
MKTRRTQFHKQKDIGGPIARITALMKHIKMDRKLKVTRSSEGFSDDFEIHDGERVFSMRSKNSTKSASRDL